MIRGMRYKYIVIIKGKRKNNVNFTSICGYRHNFIPLWWCLLKNKVKGYEVTIDKN